MRPPNNVHALVVLGKFERLRIFPTAQAAEAHRDAQINRLKDTDAIEAWEDAQVVSYRRVERRSKKTEN